MEALFTMYIGVSVDEQPWGLNLCCWMSPDNSFEPDHAQYPYLKSHTTDVYCWMIYSNQRLSDVMLQMIGEYAEKQCVDTTQFNLRRQVVNRK